MSFSRENVVWQQVDGRWAIGFFTAIPVGDTMSEDYDPEWGVEYDYSEFSWARGGFFSEEAAIRSWTGSNPAGHIVYEEQGDHTAALDKMLLDYLERRQDVRF